MKNQRDLHTPFRSHLVSAGIGTLYALLLHLAVWFGYGGAYVAVPENGNHLPKILVPACIMLVGLIIFVVIRSLTSESLTFYGAVLLTHILLSLLFLGIGGYLMDALQSIKGEVPPVDSPDGDLSWIYALVNWILLAVGMGLLLFLLSVIFTVRDALRKAMGHIPKEKKKASRD